MAKEKHQARRIGPIIILLLVVVGALLVIAEVSTNVINEVASYNDPGIKTFTPSLLPSHVPGEPTATLFEMKPLE